MEKTIVEACTTHVNKTVVMADHKVALHIPSGLNDAHPDGASDGASFRFRHPRFAIPDPLLSVFCCLSAHERAMTLSETEATQQVRDWGFTTAFTWTNVPYVYPTPRHPWLDPWLLILT